MKTNLGDTLKSIYAGAQKWLSLQIEYCKLTVAEKASILIGALIAGAICALFGLIVIVLVSFTLVEVFATIVPQSIAYLCVAGIYVVITVVMFLLRRVLIINPVSRFITKVLLDKKEEKQ